MYSRKSKEDTWNTKDLQNSIKDVDGLRTNKHENKSNMSGREKESEEERRARKREERKRKEREREKDADFEKEHKKSNQVNDSDRYNDKAKHKEKNQNLKFKDDKHFEDMYEDTEKLQGNREDRLNRDKRHKDKEVRHMENRFKDKEDGHRDREDKHRDREDRHRDSEDKHRDRKDRHKYMEDRHENKESRHRDRENKHRDKEDKHRDRENKHRDREDRHKGNKDRHKENKDRHRDREDRNRDREDRHIDQEDKHRNKEKKHRDREDRHRDKDQSYKDKEGRHRDREDRYRDREQKRNEHYDREELSIKNSDEKIREERGHRDKKEQHRDREKRHIEKEKRHETREKDFFQEQDFNGVSTRHRERKEKHTYKEEEAKKHKERKERSDNVTNKKEKVETAESYDYEDDFEDYDDDFEEDCDKSEYNDDSESEYKSKTSNNNLYKIKKALIEENSRLLSPAAERISERNSEERRENKYFSNNPPSIDSERTFINFNSAKQRQLNNAATSKTHQRADDIQKLIDLDVSSYDIFNMPPIGEYDFYMLSYGSSNTKQAYVQTNEENVERDTQTEDIDINEKWSQHPPEDYRCCGEGLEVSMDDGYQSLNTASINSAHFDQFLLRSSQVILIMLEENRASQIQSTEDEKQSNICISEAYKELKSPEFLKDRYVVYSEFSQVHSHFLLTVHSEFTQLIDEPKKIRGGFICVWNINEPSFPQKVLTCESQPTCCCFSPTKITSVYAGMKDGSLAVWDLREMSSDHKTFTDTQDNNWTFRTPTYHTAGITGDDNHLSNIVAIKPMVSRKESVGVASSTNTTADSHLNTELSFQLITVDSLSVVNLWVIVEILNPNMSGSEFDLGLSPGGRIKLVKSSSIIIHSSFKLSLCSHDLQLLPSDPSHFYIATDLGKIIHGTRHGVKAPPKSYVTETGYLLAANSIDFSPFSEPVFLVGYEDGSLRIYKTTSETPLLTWNNTTKGQPIIQVRWCRSRPSVFFVLDSTSTLYIWDLLMSDASPLRDEKISHHRVTSLSLSNDHSATGMGTVNQKPQIVICLENGSVDAHTISREFSALMPEEIDQFAQLLNNLS